MSEPRAGATATREDPFYRLLADEARDGVAGVVNDESSYKTQGSAGQGNWAETPWVAVFDLNVTDTAQRGYYIVYLFRRDGSEVFLSLNQGTTAVFRVVGAREYEAALQGRAASYARYVGEDALAGLQRGPIDLGGGRPPLTPGYQAGNIAATQYRAGAVPAESELRSDLQRFLSLYSGLVEVLDEVRAADDESIAADPVERTEAKRWAWHKRAEGRNRKAVQDAKRYHGYKCRACDIDFEGRYGQLGKRCIDAHHLEPFAELDDRPRRLNPITDFAIVCSNCHRMLHSRTPPLNVAELQDQLRGAN